MNIGTAEVCENCAYAFGDRCGAFECKRHAPAPHAPEQWNKSRLWPIVRADDWCGDFAAKPSGEPA